MDYSNYNSYKVKYDFGGDSAYNTLPSFSRELKCGDCLRAGHIYCVKGDIFGKSYTDREPFGACCFDKYNCPMMERNDFKCSDKYNDDIYQYQICPMNKKTCSDDSIDLDYSTNLIRNLTSLTKGQVCNFKIKSSCGYPAYKVIPNDAKSYNITFVEYETEKIFTIAESSNLQLTKPEDSEWLVMPETTFNYYKHTHADLQTKEM